MVLNKLDLLPYVRFDPMHCIECARRVNRDMFVFPFSATRGDDMQAWPEWIEEWLRARASEASSVAGW